MIWEIVETILTIAGGLGLIRLGWLTVTGRILTRAEANEYAIRDSITPRIESAENALQEASKQPPLSWASEQILRAYQSLPAGSQTYGPIEDTLRALDTKHDRHMLNAHFYIPAGEFDGWRGGYSWIGLPAFKIEPDSWTGKVGERHQHKTCIGSEHYELYEAVMAIKTAIAQREKAIELAGIQHELGAVPTLLEALKIEAEANRP